MPLLLACALACACGPKTGGCLQNTKTGFIWRIKERRALSYLAEPWTDGRWGKPAKVGSDFFKVLYEPVSCPAPIEIVE